jgi:hypothetical protein
MLFHQKELLISRIKAGFIKCGEIYIKKPSLEIEYEANELMMEAIDKGGVTDEEMGDYLISEGLWSEEEEKQLNKILPDHIDYWKQKIYESLVRTNEQKKCRKYLQKAREEKDRLYIIRHQFDYFTCEGYGRYVKNLFLVANSSYTKDGKTANIDPNILLRQYHSLLLTEKEMRELSRTNPWVDEWRALGKQGKIFENGLTYEQKTLISWSMLYDNVHESMDCPSDEVINDDDMLDGWLIKQRKERERDKKQKETEGVLSNSKIANAGEVFVMVDTKEDAERITELNSISAENIRKSRLKQVEKKGSVKEQNFADSKREQMMLATQAQRERK